MNLQFREVEPLSGAAPYFGGKKMLATRIIRRLEKIPHLCYAEPFLGMGGVFFRRRLAARVEVVNDASHDVATFFRVLQRHYQAFVDMVRWQITTRMEFERLVATRAETLTDLERAARFFYLQRTGFGGKVVGRSFGTAATRAGAFDITRLIPHLEELHARLASVTIECLPYADFIKRYDRPATLFYLDPPYYGFERLYEGGFTREDFGHLAQALGEITGRFIMSMNDCPEVRRIFASFSTEAVETTYTAGGPSRVKKARELIISNV